MNEKIAAALKSIEGAEFCGYCGAPIEPDETYVTGYAHYEGPASHDAHPMQDPEYPVPRPLGGVALGAALRLAAAVEGIDARMESLSGYVQSDYNDYDPAPDADRIAGLRAALDAFLAALPEVEKWPKTASALRQRRLMPAGH